VYTAVITAILFLASISPVGVALAAASNPQVVVEHVTDLGVFKGRHYVEVDGLMVGTVARANGSSGSYRVPMIMAFPTNHGNGVGVVDVPNSAIFGLMPNLPLTEENVLQFALKITHDYLFRGGYTYLSVQWAKTVTDRLGADPPPGRLRRLGYGEIERTEDRFEIIKDASRLLRYPPFLGDMEIPEPLEHVLAFGYSQTAGFMTLFIRGGSNQEGGSLLYDGFAMGGNINANATPFPTGQGKILSFFSESDAQNSLAHLDRASVGLADYRHYELAGVAHLPKPVDPQDAFGATRQNPADFSPVVKGIFANLTAWIRNGDDPPASKFIEGTVLSDGTFEVARDADGNALGGLRLPHMPSVLCDDKGHGHHDKDHCEAAGAPLGVYTGLETNTTNVLVLLGGTFEPFSPEELKERYGTQGNYVRLVRRAAKELREQDYILQEDYTKYVREAARQQLW
jgi:hypothetical protein